MTVDELIKKTRTDNGLTQEEYGLKFGVTRQTVSSWENGRSLPDLHMLIAICNVYHISLDKLLNENEEMVEKIDFRLRVWKYLKYALVVVAIVVVIMGIFSINWNIKATEINRKYAITATQAGFELKDGIYIKNSEDVIFQLPNQSLPFPKKDFIAKFAYAKYQTQESMIDITLRSEKDVSIEIDSSTSIQGIINADGTIEFDYGSASLNIQNQFENNQTMIEKIIMELQTYYALIY